MLKWGDGSGGWYPITSSTTSSSSFPYRVPEKGIGHQGGKFRIFVMTLKEEIKDSSDNYFSIIKKPTPPLVDLNVTVSTRCNAGIYRGLFILIRIKNNGTKILHDVLFNWMISSYGVMRFQDGAGFGVMHPGVWYEAKYNYKPYIVKRHRTAKPGKYKVTVTVDPANRHGEPVHLRKNNTATAYGDCSGK